METFVWFMCALVVLSFLRILWRDRAAIAERLRPAPVSSIPVPEVRPALRVVMSPRKYHTRMVRKFHARNAERNRERNAGTGEQRYVTERRQQVIQKHARGERLTRDDILALMPIRKQEAAKLYDATLRATADSLSDAEFVERFARKSAAA